MATIRTFLAVPLDRVLKLAVGNLQQALRDRIPGVSWARPESMHLTLHFFGDVSQETLEKIKVSVLSVKRCQRPFPVEVKGLGAFPSLQRPRVIWLGLEPEAQLKELHGICRQRLRQAGVATEMRPYSPHLTIGRLRHKPSDLTGLPGEIGEKPLGRMQVDRLILYESRLQPGGAEHIPLLTVPFDDIIDHP